MVDSFVLNKKHKIQEGAPVPLFDRLVDFEPDVEVENPILNFTDEEGLKSSIQRELENILDTRLSSHQDLTDSYRGDQMLLPEFYGVRDFESLSADSAAAFEPVRRAIRTAIKRFEPRLLDPEVVVVGKKDVKSTLQVQVHGEIMINKQRKAVTFPVTLRNLMGR